MNKQTNKLHSMNWSDMNLSPSGLQSSRGDNMDNKMDLKSDNLGFES